MEILIRHIDTESFPGFARVTVDVDGREEEHVFDLDDGTERMEKIRGLLALAMAEAGMMPRSPGLAVLAAPPERAVDPEKARRAQSLIGRRFSV